jgi:hypothetical protein
LNFQRWIVKIRYISLAVSAVILCGISACTYRVAETEREFELIDDGAPENNAVKKLGTPDVVETFTSPFFRYASEPCRLPCVRRLWWEHPILKGFEAWSVEVGSTGTILKKTHWVSP